MNKFINIEGWWVNTDLSVSFISPVGFDRYEEKYNFEVSFVESENRVGIYISDKDEDKVRRMHESFVKGLTVDEKV